MSAQPAEEAPLSRLAGQAAPAILGAFERHQEQFAEISRRARGRFERRDWKGALNDAAERLDLYGKVIDGVERDVRQLLGPRVLDRMPWAAIKAVYSSSIAGRPDLELAETFFNSVTRRVFATLGVDPNIEFVDSDFESPPVDSEDGLCREYRAAGAAGLFEAILADGWFEAPYEDAARDARAAAEKLSEQLAAQWSDQPPERVELVASPFFRRKGAYLIGRVFCGGRAFPFGVALLNGPAGVVVDAVLADEDDISILFSFTRSHFHVDLGPPHALVRYLKLLMPKKPVAELYIALGHHKHGKTELYRDLLRHLRDSEEPFELAPGTPGMVMVVFTMAGYDVVFKVIRDRFPAIKPITPSAVRDNYRLVFRHDRAGRLVEAQEFEHLKFERGRFADEVVAEFRRDADRTVAVGEAEVVVHHAYIERRVTPKFLSSTSPGKMLAAASSLRHRPQSSTAASACSSSTSRR